MIVANNIVMWVFLQKIPGRIGNKAVQCAP